MQSTITHLRTHLNDKNTAFQTLLDTQKTLVKSQFLDHSQQSIDNNPPPPILAPLLPSLKSQLLNLTTTSSCYLYRWQPDPWGRRGWEWAREVRDTRERERKAILPSLPRDLRKTSPMTSSPAPAGEEKRMRQEWARAARVSPLTGNQPRLLVVLSRGKVGEH